MIHPPGPGGGGTLAKKGTGCYLFYLHESQTGSQKNTKIQSVPRKVPKAVNYQEIFEYESHSGSLFRKFWQNFLKKLVPRRVHFTNLSGAPRRFVRVVPLRAPRCPIFLRVCSKSNRRKMLNPFFFPHRYSLAFLRVGDVKDDNSIVEGCSFNDGYNTGILLFYCGTFSKTETPISPTSKEKFDIETNRKIRLGSSSELMKFSHEMCFKRHLYEGAFNKETKISR